LISAAAHRKRALSARVRLCIGIATNQSGIGSGIGRRCLGRRGDQAELVVAIANKLNALGLGRNHTGQIASRQIGGWDLWLGWMSCGKPEFWCIDQDGQIAPIDRIVGFRHRCLLEKSIG
jgi:hypothetical protein